jgi:very-short-patch-repair endonuclease
LDLPKILHRAGELRKQTTSAEKKLWAYLRLMREDGVRFRRQYAIGPYIPDFCAPRKKIVIELDGTPFGRSIWSKKNMTKQERNI